MLPTAGRYVDGSGMGPRLGRPTDTPPTPLPRPSQQPQPCRAALGSSRMAGKPHWEDHVLVHAAAVLSAAGDAEAAEALISSSVLAVQFGHSWWDGHDDYVYDVELTLTAHADAGRALSSSEGLVPALRR